MTDTRRMRLQTLIEKIPIEAQTVARMGPALGYEPEPMTEYLDRLDKAIEEYEQEAAKLDDPPTEHLDNKG